MVFSYYQPLDPFGHSFHYVHIAQREGRETMTAARHKLCQNSQGQKLYRIYAALMRQTYPPRLTWIKSLLFYNCILQPVLLYAI